MGKDSLEICNEIKEIVNLISSAAMVMAVRKEVSKIAKEGFVVMNASHCFNASSYDVIVRCGKSREVSRRLRNSSLNVDVERIAKGVLGIKYSRRMGVR